MSTALLISISFAFSFLTFIFFACFHFRFVMLRQFISFQVWKIQDEHAQECNCKHQLPKRPKNMNQPRLAESNRSPRVTKLKIWVPRKVALPGGQNAEKSNFCHKTQLSHDASHVKAQSLFVLVETQNCTLSASLDNPSPCQRIPNREAWNKLSYVVNSETRCIFSRIDNFIAMIFECMQRRQRSSD